MHIIAYIGVMVLMCSGALAWLRPMRVNLIPVATDGDGIVPSDLQRILDSWPRSQPRPKALYTIPTGQTPWARDDECSERDAIYALVCQHDLIVLDDSP